MPQSKSPETALQLYLSQIRPFPLLSADRERQLARQLIQSGDQAAREELVVSNLRLVVHIAKGYLRRGLALQDLIEEGNLGLIKAVDAFDPEMNVRLSTYAAWWIRQKMRRAINNSGHSVRLPMGVAEMLARLNRATSELQGRLGSAPQSRELAEQMKLSTKKIMQLQRAAASRRTLSDSQARGDELLMHEMVGDAKAVSPEHHVVQQDQLRAMGIMLDRLNSREAHIIRMRYGLGAHRSLTLKEIGQELGMKRQRVQQIQIKALQRLHFALSGGRLGMNVSGCSTRSPSIRSESPRTVH